MSKTSPCPGESPRVTNSCAEWNWVQFAPGSAGHRLENREFFPRGQGGVYTAGEALDLGLRGDQALGAEGTI